MLDEISDYVAHNIIPPKELQKDYFELLKQKKETENRNQEERLSYVNDLYSEKINWWHTDWKRKAVEKKEKARREKQMQIEKERIDSIAALNKYVTDSILSAKKLLPDAENKAVADSLMIVKRVKNGNAPNKSKASSDKVISGIVFSEHDNSPLPGVSVIVKGSTEGTLTDAKGHFSIEVPQNAIIRFRHPGCRVQEVDATALNDFAIELKEVNMWLDDVVIPGYKMMKGSLITSSLAIVKADYYAENMNHSNVIMDVEKLHVAGELKMWNPEVPYLDSLKQVEIADAYAKHLVLRNQYLDNPSYFLDVATFLMNRNDAANAIRVLSNLSEIQMQNHEVLRVLGRKLLEFGEIESAIEVFKQVLELRPFEPHSFRDLGLAYAENKEYQKALETLYHLIITPWSEHIEGKFEGMETIVIGEINSIIAKSKKKLDIGFIDKRFLVNLPTDIRVVLNWDANDTDMDLWLTDPLNGKCSYNNNRTNIGGCMSEDLIDGYGPEEFLLKNAIEGSYKIEVDYFGNSRQSISGPVTIEVLLYSNYGKHNESMKRATVRLSENKKEIHIGDLLFELNK